MCSTRRVRVRAGSSRDVARADIRATLRRMRVDMRVLRVTAPCFPKPREPDRLKPSPTHAIVCPSRRRRCPPRMSTESNSYLRRLGTWDGAMIVIGGVIGAGIFRTPATLAQRTGSGWELLALWAVGGLLTLAGALSYAELGARRPQAG